MTTNRKLFDTESIRAAVSIPDLLKSRGWPLRKRPEGWRGPCPIHKGEGKTPFHVTKDGRNWYCFAQCGRGGDVIKLVREIDGLSFERACENLGGRAEQTSTPIQRPKPTPPAPAPPLPELDAAKRREMEQLVERLADDGKLIEALAFSRGEQWEPLTISALAHTNALGWLDAWPLKPLDEPMPEPDGVIAFIYPSAVKIRALWRDDLTVWKWHWPVGDRQEKAVRWLWTGWPWNKAELWRENRLRLLLHTDAAVTEGEPDAIRMVNACAETHFRTVCALPDSAISATLRARLPDLLAGLNVTYFADPDAAGMKAAREIRETIVPRVARLAIKHLAP